MSICILVLRQHQEKSGYEKKIDTVKKDTPRGYLFLPYLFYPYDTTFDNNGGTKKLNPIQVPFLTAIQTQDMEKKGFRKCFHMNDLRLDTVRSRKRR